MKKAIFLDHVEEAAAQTGRTVEDILHEVKALGYDGLECSSTHIQGKREEFLQLLQRTGLSVSSVYKHFDFGHVTCREEIAAFLDDLAFVGAKKTLIIPGFFDESSDREKEFDRMAEALLLVCELASPLGITVTMEDFDDVSSPCSTMGGLRKFMDAVPGLRFTMDTGNFRYSCEDALEAFELLKDRLAHVHLKDRSESPMTEGDGGPLAVDGKRLYPAPVGSGYIPVKKCIELAKEAGYDGWFSAEHFNSADMMGYIRRSAEFLAAF